MNLDFLDWKDLVVIFNVVFFTNLLKYVIKFKHIYVYIPIFLSIVIFVVLLFLKVYVLKDMIFIIFKWITGSMLLYETILEKIQKIWDSYDKEKGGNDV